MSVEDGSGKNHDPQAGWLACDECKFMFQKSKLRKRYDGFIVCNKCYEEEHPLDIAKREKQLLNKRVSQDEIK